MQNGEYIGRAEMDALETEVLGDVAAFLARRTRPRAFSFESAAKVPDDESFTDEVESKSSSSSPTPPQMLPLGMLSRGFCTWGVVAIERKRRRLIVVRQRYLSARRLAVRCIRMWHVATRLSSRAVTTRDAQWRGIARVAKHAEARLQKRALRQWLDHAAFSPPPPLEAIDELASKRLRATSRLVVAKIATLKRSRANEFLARDAFEAWRAAWRHRAQLQLVMEREQRHRARRVQQLTMRGWKAEVQRNRSYRQTLSRATSALTTAARDAAHATTTRRSAFLAWKLVHASFVEVRLARWDAAVRISDRLRRLRRVVVAADHRLLRRSCDVWRGAAASEQYAAQRVARTLRLARPLLAWRIRRHARTVSTAALRRSHNIATRRSRAALAKRVLRHWRSVAATERFTQNLHEACIAGRRRRRRTASCWRSWVAELSTTRRCNAVLRRLAYSLEVHCFRRARTLFARQSHRRREGLLTLDALDLVNRPVDDAVQRHCFRVWRAATRSSQGNALGQRLLQRMARTRLLEHIFGSWKVFALRMLLRRTHARQAWRKIYGAGLRAASREEGAVQLYANTLSGRTFDGWSQCVRHRQTQRRSLGRATARARTCRLRAGLGRWRFEARARRQCSKVATLVERSAAKCSASTAAWALRAWHSHVSHAIEVRDHAELASSLGTKARKMSCARVCNRLIAVAHHTASAAFQKLSAHATSMRAQERSVEKMAHIVQCSYASDAFARWGVFTRISRRMERLLGRLKDAQSKSSTEFWFRRFQSVCSAARREDGQREQVFIYFIG